jgi:hypothetical protein
MTTADTQAGRATVRPIMPIECIDDWDKRLARVDAFWARAILDRPVVVARLPKASLVRPWPKRSYPTERARWMDVDYVVACALADVANHDYLGDALPTAWPNLGPEVFSAFFGTELEYGPDTSWSVPNLLDWRNVEQVRFSKDNVYWSKLVEMTKALLEAGRNRFYTGMTDLHPGGDALVAFRDPGNMNIDMVEEEDAVRALLRRVTDTYLEVYDFYADWLVRERQAITNWTGIVSTKRHAVPSNDFSCMISKAMFDDVFLPGIIEECRHMDANIYHLDGPNALRHLDSLLAIAELDAVQWVYGAGNGPGTKWMHVYKRCQKAEKGLQITMRLDEVDAYIAELRPEGLWIAFDGPCTRDGVEAAIRKIEKWR